MSLKAGRVGVAPDQVTELGKIKEKGDYYTKDEVDEKFEEVGEDLDALTEDISDINLKVPFSFGVDMTDPSNPVYGYKKAGADTVTPFKSGFSGGIIQRNDGEYRIVILFKYDGQSPNPHPEYDIKMKFRLDSESEYTDIANFIQIDKENSIYMGIINGLAFGTVYNLSFQATGLQVGRKTGLNTTFTPSSSNHVFYISTTTDIKDAYVSYGFSYSS